MRTPMHVVNGDLTIEGAKRLLMSLDRVITCAVDQSELKTGFENFATRCGGGLYVASTVMTYRCSASVTARSCFCHGCPVGTKYTSSSANRYWTSVAATRCPRWIGSKVPPMTPILRRAVILSDRR